MEYQRATKSAQKVQSKTPSSSLHQTSLNHIAVRPLLELQRTIGNQAVLNDASTQAFRESCFGHDFSRIPIHSTQTAVPQMKLKVSQPGDVYEQEADQFAEQVMRMANPEASVSDDEGEAKNSPTRKQGGEPQASAATKSRDVPPIVQAVLNSGRGQPLDPTTRAFMEPRFGHDFSQVQVHTDERAAESAQAVNALAYTVGRNVVFGPGQYALGTSKGQKLLAHELAHVVQQQKTISNYLTENVISQPSDPAEYEAEHASQTIIRGGHASQVVSIGRGIQRDDGGAKAPAASKLLDAFKTKFPDAAKLINSNSSTMKLVNEAESAGVQFGGYAEDGPFKDVRAYTIDNTVYVPKSYTDKVVAMKGFLFELNNAIHKPKFKALNIEATKGAKGSLTAKDYAYKTVEQEVEGMLRTGEIWFEMKKTSGSPKEWDKYDADFYLSEYQDFKAKKKSKDDIIKAVLKRVYPSGVNKGKTVERFYMEEYNSLAGGK